MNPEKSWKKALFDFCASIKWFTAASTIGFGVLLYTAPSLFGNVIIRTTAILSVVIYATVAALIGYAVRMIHKRKLENDLEEYYKSH